MKNNNSTPGAKEQKLNQLKELYIKDSAAYNKKHGPLFMSSFEIARLKQIGTPEAHKKAEELESKLAKAEGAVTKLLAQLNEEMMEIARLEKELYGEKAAKPDSPSILEKKEVYMSKSK